MSKSPDARLEAFVPGAEKTPDPNNYVLTPEDMEKIRLIMPPWEIQSSMNAEGSQKTFSTSLPANKELWDKLYVAFCDEFTDEEIYEIFGGQGERVSVWGIMKSSIREGDHVEVSISTQGGPLTLGDIDRIVEAENCLVDKGYLSESRARIQSIE